MIKNLTESLKYIFPYICIAVKCIAFGLFYVIKFIFELFELVEEDDYSDSHKSHYNVHTGEFDTHRRPDSFYLD